MNPTQNDSRDQDRMTQKASYAKPSLTTFGSVAKLTHGTHSAGNDGALGHTKNLKG